MARGESGRVVIEIDPQLKADLHSALSGRGTTMKAWFVKEAENFLAEHAFSSRVAESPTIGYRAHPSAGQPE